MFRCFGPFRRCLSGLASLISIDFGSGGGGLSSSPSSVGSSPSKMMAAGDPRRWFTWTENTKSFSVALFYWCCSISMNFLNKAVVSSYEFNFPYFIMVCQMALTVVFLDSLRLLGMLNLPPFSLKDGKDFLPASLCFALHATLSLSALHGMNIPMYGAIKRCTPLVSLVLSVTVLRKALPSKYIILSIILITVGCLVAGIGDLDFDRHAYVLGIMCVFAQGGYLTLVQKSSESKKSTLEMVHINSYNTLPFFIIMSLFFQEPALISDSQAIHDINFFFTFLVLIFAGCILTYSQFLCAAICSALTASLVGVAKAVLQTVIGFFVFGGVKFHPLNIIGLVLNILGGIMYSYVKYMEGGVTGKSRDKAGGLLHPDKKSKSSSNFIIESGHSSNGGPVSNGGFLVQRPMIDGSISSKATHLPAQVRFESESQHLIPKMSNNNSL